MMQVVFSNPLLIESGVLFPITALGSQMTTFFIVVVSTESMCLKTLCAPVTDTLNILAKCP